jgi:hypothetical protein
MLGHWRSFQLFKTKKKIIEVCDYENLPQIFQLCQSLSPKMKKFNKFCVYWTLTKNNLNETCP